MRGNKKIFPKTTSSVLKMLFCCCWKYTKIV